MAITLGLLAAILWGVADFLARFSARGLGPWRSTFYGQIPGCLIFSVCLIFIPAFRHPALAAPHAYWGLALLAAAINTVSNYAMVRGLIVGALSLVVPVVASYGAVSTVLAVLTGEHLALPAAIGIALTVLGIAVTAMRRGARTTDPHHRGAGIGWAVLAAFGYGTALWLQGRFVMPHMGPVAPLWIGSLSSILLAITVATVRRHNLMPPPARLMPYTFGYGTLTGFAFLCLALGLATGQVAIVAVLSSLCSTITAILGFALLKERLTARQWSGILLILVGVGLINVR
ncbi:DMT family transporter [Acidisoma cellulosilytica]|uniref:DMT family transporter n=1 Tax=Acidisoma cellulosilyticum TaxID=2802395 RepID=A0A963Z0E6_9PROT|nr:DMT family transporter [Acidisoma cellulosilyticum]MCB8879548.1 DMT family transporter [Acidisoma cellulosilyticum]